MILCERIEIILYDIRDNITLAYISLNTVGLLF